MPKNSPINSVAQLRGKRIAVAQGSSADYHLLTVLTKAGMTVHDVTLNYLQPADALAALQLGSRRRVGHLVAVHRAGRGAGQRAGRWSPDRVRSPYSFEVASRAALADPAKAAAIKAYLKLLAQAHAWATRTTRPGRRLGQGERAAGQRDGEGGQGRRVQAGPGQHAVIACEQ